MNPTLVPGETYFATAPQGLEPLLANELERLGARTANPTRGGVAFTGPLETAYRACLWSRLANRILLPIAEFQAADADELYRGAVAIDWARHLAADGTLAVDFASQRGAVAHSHFGALRVKDAIVDRLRTADGVRPSIDLERPDVRVRVLMRRDSVRVSLDLSGDSLHRRGYRERGVPAPLKENLAAAILLRAGWADIAAAGGAFLDPMCGSGTLPIEAALIAGDIAPGLQRTYFGLFGWLGYDRTLWQRLVDEALERREAGLRNMPRIAGSDADLDAVRAALGNVGRAELDGVVHIERRPLEATRPIGKTPGLVAANPPYGERLGSRSRLVPLYSGLGNHLKTHFGGWHVALLTADAELASQLGLRAERGYTVRNGPIECRLGIYPIGARGADTTSPGARMFANRLQKNRKRLGSWARRHDIDCYRLYDADLPEYALAVDLYQGTDSWVHVQEYRAPRTVAPERAAKRLREALAVLPEVLDVPPGNIYYKVRERQKGRAQYERVDNRGEYHEVREGPCRLLVNLRDYLDTGLFLDHRITRQRIGALARDRRVLNLFAYTGAASVHAAVGGARSTTSVDLSKTYLDWARRNLALNGFKPPAHQLVHADCLVWLEENAAERTPQFDLIFLDPPTFSNSKRMQRNFDVQRDHVQLIRHAMTLLSPDGVLIFSNNYRGFALDRDALGDLRIEDISRATLPEDFARNPKIHVCFEIRHPA